MTFGRSKAQEIVLAAVHEAERQGAELAEAFYNNSEELTIEVRDGEVETLKVAGEEGLGLRVFKRGCMGYAFTSELSLEAFKDVARAALENSLVTAEDPFNKLPEPSGGYPQLELDDPAIAATTLDEKIEKARSIESSGRGFDPRVQITDRVAYEDSHYLVAIASSRGLESSFQGSYCGGYAVFVADDKGQQETGYGLQFTRKYTEFNPQAVGREAAEKAVRMLGAGQLGTMRAPVVFEPYVFSGFLGLLASSLTAEAVQKGRSLFAGKLDKMVASSTVTLIDDSTLPGGLLSYPFDGEGIAGQRKVLVENGCLQGFLHNTYTAIKEGAKSTGNAARSSYKSPPEIGSTNFYLAPGTMTKEEIIKNTQRGLYVTEVMGMHTANPVSGDFSVGAAGILIEQGELTNPVRGIVMSGNLHELIGKIDIVGSDLRFFVGKGAPTIRVSDLTISG